MLFYHNDTIQYNGPEPAIKGQHGRLVRTIDQWHPAYIEVGRKLYPVHLDQITLVRRPIANHLRNIMHRLRPASDPRPS